MLQANSRINRIMPVIGFGTWELTGRACVESTEDAIRMGYRHIDTAQLYHNETEVGKAIKRSGIDRSDLFITTKVATGNLQPERIKSSTLESRTKMNLEYIDLLLIHWPIPQMELKACLDSMFELQLDDIIRYVGVSNFGPELFMEAIRYGPVLNNQVKFSPFLQQMKNLYIARNEEKIITAYSPLERGKIPKNTILGEIGGRYHKSAAQTALRWLIQLGHVSVIPKAARQKHRKENLEIFDFELTGEEMQKITELGSY